MAATKTKRPTQREAVLAYLKERSTGASKDQIAKAVKRKTRKECSVKNIPVYINQLREQGFTIEVERRGPGKPGLYTLAG